MKSGTYNKDYSTHYGYHLESKEEVHTTKPVLQVMLKGPLLEKNKIKNINDKRTITT